MNASASALPREDDVQSKIRKVRAFGRNARVVCAALFGFGIVGSVFLLLLFLALMFAPSDAFGPNSANGGMYSVMTAPLTPLLFKVWVSFLQSVAIGVWLAVVYQLYRLFGNLAAGSIYTSENVRRVRNVGLLWLLWAVLGLVLPGAIAFAHRFVDAPVPMDLDRLVPSFGELLSSFVAAGLVLLVSWIMDIGLHEKDHADELRRDAELTI